MSITDDELLAMLPEYGLPGLWAWQIAEKIGRWSERADISSQLRRLWARGFVMSVADGWTRAPAKSPKETEHG